MAVSRCAIVPFKSPPLLLPPHSIGRRLSFKLIRCSSVSPPFPSRPSKRKNYLRPKILRTLKPEPSETNLIPLEYPETVPPNNSISDQIDGVEELHVSDSSAVAEEHSGIIGKLSPKSVAKYGLYLLGVFAFQTVFAVWFLGNSSNSRKASEISNDRGLLMGTTDTKNSSKRRILLNGSKKHCNEKNGVKSSNVIDLDELEMNEKIAEIQAMAREARKTEQKGSEDEYDEDSISDGESSLSGRVDIEKEIGAKLANMEKRLNSQRKGLAGLRVKSLDKSRNEDEDCKKGDLDMEGNEEILMFEKKYKFKAEKPPRNVKGFPGRGEGRGNTRTDKEKHGLNGSADHLLKAGKKSEEMQKETGTADSEMISGTVQEIHHGRSSDEIKKSRKSDTLGGQDSNLEVEKMEAASESHGTSMSNHTSNSTHGDVKIEKPIRKVGDRQSNAGDAWWLKLPYVLRIRMQSNIDQEISEGYFTLRTNCVDPSTDESSYAVAFEDQNDARNFCYLLESFFEDLGGFSADIVPTSTKDLHNEVSSSGKNVIVVKKRQLKLYAGQPFEDVERALHSLIHQ